MRRLTLFLFTTLVLISLAATAVTAPQIHVVQRGENLFQIARMYGRTVQELAQANGISPPYVIHAGNEITIPAPGGDTQAPAQDPGTATGSEETHCYILGDSCLVISNACYLDWWPDCGDGATWESQYLWKQGWCVAAIFAGVIVGTIKECIEGNSLTVAERAPISSIIGMSAQRNQYQRSNTGGNQQSNTGGNNQQGAPLVLTPINPQGDQGPQDGGPPPPDNTQYGGQPQIHIDRGEPPQNQRQFTLLQQQLPQGPKGDQGPKGEQGGGNPSDSYPPCGTVKIPVSYYDRGATRPVQQTPCIDRNPRDHRQDKPNTVSGEGNVKQPNYIPRTPASGSCRGGGSDCFNCGWQMEKIFGGKSRTETHRRCTVKGQDPCTAYEDVTINIASEPDKTTWRYVCS